MITDEHREALDRDGYTIFRDALPRDWLGPLRDTFERLDTPSENWPAPRERGTRHAMLDGDEGVERACMLPILLDGVRYILDGAFHLKSVEGRDPMPDRGFQRLHRDWLFGDHQPMGLVKALAFLDDFGPENGATRVVPGSHSGFGDWQGDSPAEIFIRGKAGDVFLFHGRLVHAGFRNTSGAKRRALQIWYNADV